MRRAPASESGFVLIAAIWLLLLCAAMVAVLMLRGQTQATAAADAGDRLKTRLALESAVETVVAEVLFNGQASRWGTLPASGEVRIDDTTIAVRVTDESGRLDLNTVELDTLDTALRGFGIPAVGRGALVAALKAGRAAQHRIAGWADVEHLLAKLGAPTGRAACLEDEVTIYSGGSKPNERQMSAALARALGVAGGSEGGRVEPGAAVRIEARMPAGLQLTAVVRITGLIDAPYAVSNWMYGGSC